MDGVSIKFDENWYFILRRWSCLCSDAREKRFSHNIKKLKVDICWYSYIVKLCIYKFYKRYTKKQIILSVIAEFWNLDKKKIWLMYNLV